MRSRARGGTFTIIVLVSSALLLAIGGAFVGSSRNLSVLVGQRERSETAKEALAGAAEWSTARVATWPAERKTEEARLRFSRCNVEIKIEAAVSSTSPDRAFLVEATAHTPPRVAQSARWLLEKKGDGWVVVRYENK